MAFITNFWLDQLPLYLKATRTSDNKNLFSVRDVGNHKQLDQGSLYFSGNGDLTEFWKHFNSLKEQFDSMSKNGASVIDLLKWSNQPLDPVVHEKVRFGQILIGQDFNIPGSPVVFRRTKGLYAAPVAHIGGHVNGYGSTGFPFDLNMEVVRVPKEDPYSKEIEASERPRGG